MATTKKATTKKAAPKKAVKKATKKVAARKTYQFNMTISTKKNVEHIEIIDKLIQFAEDNGYWLGGGLTLLKK